MNTFKTIIRRCLIAFMALLALPFVLAASMFTAIVAVFVGVFVASRIDTAIPDDIKERFEADLEAIRRANKCDS